MKHLKDLASHLRQINGIFARQKKDPSDVNTEMLKEQLSSLKTLLNEMKLD
jgi:hypothetical protein